MFDILTDLVLHSRDSPIDVPCTIYSKEWRPLHTYESSTGYPFHSPHTDCSICLLLATRASPPRSTRHACQPATHHAPRSTTISTPTPRTTDIKHTRLAAKPAGTLCFCTTCVLHCDNICSRFPFSPPIHNCLST